MSHSEISRLIYRGAGGHEVSSDGLTLSQAVTRDFKFTSQKNQQILFSLIRIHCSNYFQSHIFYHPFLLR